MGRFPRLFADTAMGFDGENRGIGLPEITATETAPIGLRNSVPEPPAGPFAMVANDEGD
jgi:hypothetical protein